MPPNNTKEILINLLKGFIGVSLVLVFAYGLYSNEYKKRLREGYINQEYQTENYSVYYKKQKGKPELLIGLDYGYISQVGVDYDQDLKVDIVYNFKGSFRTAKEGKGYLRRDCNKETIKKFDEHLKQAIKFLKL